MTISVENVALTGAHRRGCSLPYRPDVDGLRSIAVGSVLLFHAGIAGFSGGYVGVDIFFVVSGYLITSLLFAELDATGRVDFINFWARRTRRLMPSAIFIIVASLAVGQYILSDLKISFAARDAVYAGTYLTNWQKLLAAIDYFDDESGSGLFLHYWSLAVEEQFYLFLTLVFFLAIFSCRRFAPAVAPATIVITLLVMSGLASFGANLIAIGESQPVAFFGTHARIWELALGAGVCLMERGGYIPSRGIRLLQAWLGLAMIVCAIVLYTDQLVYPGLYALIPTFGAALLILSGINRSGRGPGAESTIRLKLLATPLPVAIGKLSYALYLWHWPVFELYKAHFGHWDTHDKAIAITVTFVLAIATYFTIENPIRFSRRLALRPVASLAGAALITATVCGAAIVIRDDKASGHIVLADGSAYDLQKVRLDQPRINKDGCDVRRHATEPRNSCIYGQLGGKQKIFLIGDSHAGHWFPAFEKLAFKFDAALFVRVKSACIGVDVPIWYGKIQREFTECATWRDGVFAEIEREAPELVVFGNSSGHKAYVPSEQRFATAVENAKLLAEGEARTISWLLDKGIKVVLLADMPWLPEDPIDCLMKNRSRPDSCQWPADKARKSLRSPWSPASHSWPDTVKVIDLLTQACPDGVCPASIGGTITMRDRHHMTTGFAAQLSVSLEREIVALLNVPAKSSRATGAATPLVFRP